MRMLWLLALTIINGIFWRVSIEGTAVRTAVLDTLRLLIVSINRLSE